MDRAETFRCGIDQPEQIGRAIYAVAVPPASVVMPPTENVLQHRLWTVNLNKQSDGGLYCEAVANANLKNVSYSVRMRMNGNAPIFMITHNGPDLPDIKEARFVIDSEATVVLPVTDQIGFGADRAIVIDIPEAQYSNVLAPKLLGKASKILEIQIGDHAFDVPVFGFEAVTGAFAKCQAKMRELSASADPSGLPSPTTIANSQLRTAIEKAPEQPSLETYESILAKQRRSLQDIAGYDVSHLPSDEAMERLKAIAANVGADVGALPPMAHDPKAHEVYVAGARSGMGAAFEAFRLWEGVEMAIVIEQQGPRAAEPQLAAFHALKVLQWKDIEASLLRDALQRIVDNPTLDSVSIRKAATRALLDDGQKIEPSLHAETRIEAEPAGPVGADAFSVVGPKFDPLRGVYDGEQASAFDHNGSWVWLFRRAGLIVYSKPKSSIAGTVRAGDVLFRGVIGRNLIRGVAYTYKGGCAPAPYIVSGSGLSAVPDDRFVLHGSAPVRNRFGCDMVATSRNSPNARLVFQGQGEFADY